MKGFGWGNSYSSLYPLVGNNAPDSASSQVTYEKGQQFMQFLLQTLDSEQDMQEFLGFYLGKYEYQSITFLEARLAFNEFVRNKYGARAQSIIDKVDWIAWVQTPGPIPANSGINFETPNTIAFNKLADDYIALNGFSSP